MFKMLNKAVVVIFLTTLLLGAVVLTSSAEDLNWPCGTSLESLEVDQWKMANFEEPGYLSINHINWGQCPAGLVRGQSDSYQTGGIRVRFAADQVKNVYLVTTTQLGFEPGIDVTSSLTLYVPDARMEEYISAGYNPVPFSEIENWEWENLLGMSPTDTIAQWVGSIPTKYEGEPVSIVYALSPTQYPDQSIGVFFTWRPTDEFQAKFKTFIPLLVR